MICLILLAAMSVHAKPPTADAKPVDPPLPMVAFTVSVDPQKVMSDAERKDFGVDKWSAEQVLDFKTWLADYAVMVVNRYSDAVSKAYDEKSK